MKPRIRPKETWNEFIIEVKLREKFCNRGLLKRKNYKPLREVEGRNSYYSLRKGGGCKMNVIICMLVLPMILW